MKNTPDENEKKFFQDRFDSFESEPDDKVWQAIRPQLPTPRPGSWLIPYGKMAAVTALVGTLSILIWQMIPSTQDSTLR